MNRIRVLLVEDDVSAAIITQAALEEGWAKRGITAEIQVRPNGLKAINDLQATEVLPDLILTDIKMPILDGLRLLNLIKSDPHLRHIPVIMISTSDNPSDVAIAFQEQCAGYLLKSADFEQFSADLETLQRYWEASQLP